jgi:hypothetical protein
MAGPFAGAGDYGHIVEKKGSEGIEAIRVENIMIA